MVGAAVLVTSAVAAPAAQADTGCEWTRQNLPLPAGQRPVGSVNGDGDWLATSGDEAAVVWHEGVPETVELPPGRGVADISRNGVLLSFGEDGLWRDQEKLEELPGAGYSTVHSINAAGDVTGMSGGPLVVWTAGSTAPHTLEGTDDGQWWRSVGIDDHGNVVGGAGSRYHVWNKEGERTALEPLQGHGEVYATLVRDGRIYGEARGDGGWISVEWNLRGEVVRDMPGGAVQAANGVGDELFMWQENWAVRRADGRVDPLPLYPRDLAFLTVLTDAGELISGRYYEGPVRVFCA
ncbi:hypothetical protein ACFWNN_11650 [Lentzea sp. NPDC058450]|uniref:hypothetical protein n=1 Tax=Lentzea sp. NPDC058450 TaxID=3346505 RepID=UPI003666C0B3